MQQRQNDRAKVYWKDTHNVQQQKQALHQDISMNTINHTNTQVSLPSYNNSVEIQKSKNQSILLLLFIIVIIVIILAIFFEIIIIQHTGFSKSIVDKSQKSKESQFREKYQKKYKQINRQYTFAQNQRNQLKILTLEKDIREINEKIQQLTLSQLEMLKLQHVKSQKYQQDLENIEEKNHKISENQTKLINNTILGQPQTFFPKVVWMYIEQSVSEEPTLVQQLILNLAEYLQDNGYDFYIIGEHNYRYLMSNRHEQQMGYILADLWYKAFTINQTSNLRDHIYTIKKNLISLIMLSEGGGILIDKDIFLTQDLSWIENLDKMSKSNRGRALTPQIIGFYHQNYTNQRQIIQVNKHLNKSIHLYPPLDPYFLVISHTGKLFIEQVLQRYNVLLVNPNSVKQIMKKYQLNLKQIQGNDPYYQSLYVAFSWVIKRRQMQLDIEWHNSHQSNLRPLAIDYYGIYTFNRVYGPFKYRFLFSDQKYEDIYYFLSKIPNSELVKYYGQVNFISIIPFREKISQFVNITQVQTKYLMIKDSFLNQYVFKDKKEEYLLKKFEKYDNFKEQEMVFWNLTKIWTFYEGKSIISELCINNIKRYTRQSGLQLIILNQENLQNFLPKNIMLNIQRRIKSQRIYEEPSTRKIQNMRLQLIKLAIINQNGGIWVDIPILAIQNFKWIIDIHKNKDVVNRFNRLPKVLLFYHPLKSNFHYTFNNKNEFEVNHKLSYLTNFIAADRRSALIQQWSYELHNNILLRESNLKKKIQSLGLSYPDLTNPSEISKITLLFILEKEYQRNNQKIQQKKNRAFERYGLWIMNGFTGIQKLKQYSNYDVGFNSTNVYFWTKSKNIVNNLLGQFNYLISISRDQQMHLNKLLQKNTIDPNFHPNSFFYEYLYDLSVINLIKQKRNQDVEQSNTPYISEIIWIYVNFQYQEKGFFKKWLQNMAFYSNKFLIEFVNEFNYKDFLVHFDHIERIITKKITIQHLFNEEIFQSIKKRIIILSLLAEKGGVYFDESVILTESIGWIKDIYHNIYTIKQKLNSISGIAMSKTINQTDKSYQIIQDYFLAAPKQSFFVKDLLSEYSIMIQQIMQIQRVQEIDKIQFSESNIFKQVLRRLNKKIQLIMKKNQYFYSTETILIDYYKLSLIQSDYFTEKVILNEQLESKQIINIFTKIDYEQLVGEIGPFRYMVKRNDWEDIYQKSIIQTIYTNSFIDKHIFLNKEQAFIKPSNFKNTKNEQSWEQLPRKVWFYRPQKATIISKMLELKLKNFCQQSNLTLQILNNDNLGSFVDQKDRQELDLKLQFINTDLDRQMHYFLYILQILIKDGGIFLTSKYFPFENFDWLFQIGQIDKTFVFNTYNNLPKMVTFNNFEEYNEQIDNRYGIKIKAHYNFTRNFIATVPQNDFLKQLSQQLINLITLNSIQLQLNLQKLNITCFGIQCFDDIINAAQDTILKNKIIYYEENPDKNIDFSKYYNIWTINRNYGPNKLNLMEEDKRIEKIVNIFGRQSEQYFNGIYGKINYFLQIDQQLIEAFDQKLLTADPFVLEQSSYFMKYIFDQQALQD